MPALTELVPPNNHADAADDCAVARYPATELGRVPLLGTKTTGPWFMAATLPPESASGKANPLASPIEAGFGKNAWATSTDVAKRSLPTNGCAEVSAWAAGPPIA